jgi:hypothetical protein
VRADLQNVARFYQRLDLFPIFSVLNNPNKKLSVFIVCPSSAIITTTRYESENEKSLEIRSEDGSTYFKEI